MRRVGGPRRNISDRVHLFLGDVEISGWALNISRGGLRAILEEERIDVGAEIEIVVGEGGARRKGRVVWTREMPDGTIAGFAFITPDLALPEGDAPPPPSSMGRGGFEALRGALAGESHEASNARDR